MQHSICSTVYVAQCMQYSICNIVYITVYVAQCMQHSICSIVYVTQCMKHSVCSIVYVAQCMQHSVYSRVYAMQYMQHNIYNIVYAAQCMQHSFCKEVLPYNQCSVTRVPTNTRKKGSVTFMKYLLGQYYVNYLLFLDPGRALDATVLTAAKGGSSWLHS